MLTLNRRQALALMGATLAAGSFHTPAIAANTKIKFRPHSLWLLP